MCVQLRKLHVCVCHALKSIKPEYWRSSSCVLSPHARRTLRTMSNCACLLVCVLSHLQKLAGQTGKLAIPSMRYASFLNSKMSYARCTSGCAVCIPRAWCFQRNSMCVRYSVYTSVYIGHAYCHIVRRHFLQLSLSWASLFHTTSNSGDLLAATLNDIFSRHCTAVLILVLCPSAQQLCALARHLSACSDQRVPDAWTDAKWDWAAIRAGQNQDGEAG